MRRVGLGLKGMSIVLDTVYTGNYALTMPGETNAVIACRCTRTRKYPLVGRARMIMAQGWMHRRYRSNPHSTACKDSRSMQTSAASVCFSH